MHYSRVTAILLVLAGTLAAQPYPSSETNQKPPELCTVSGQVVAASDGTPLKSARLVLVANNSRIEPKIFSGTSDGDGRFVIKDIPPDRYQFYAVHNGYVNEHYMARGIEEGAVLNLKPGQRVSDVVFRMVLAGVVTGRITDEDRQPLSGFRVLALRWQTDDEMDEDPSRTSKRQLLPVSEVETDDRGIYRIFGLPPGEYYVQVGDTADPKPGIMDRNWWVRRELGSEYAPVYYPGVLQIDQAQRLVLRPGDETEADFSMHRVKTVSVSGRVVVPAGVGSSVSVGLYPADSDAYIAEQGALADEKGNFQIARVPAGSYLLTATAPADGERVYTARQRIEIGTEDVDSITLVLGRGVSIRGLVRAENRSSLPGSQVFVEVLQLDSEGGASIGRVHQDGTFELFSLHEGSYEVRVFGVKPDWYVKSAKAGTEDLLEKGLQVEKDAPGVMEIVLSSASAELEGTVTDNDQPLPGAHVLLIPDPESRFNRYRFESAITDQNGHFQIKGIVPGNYRVLAKQTASSGKTPATSEPQMISFTERDRKTLAVSMAKPSD